MSPNDTRSGTGEIGDEGPAKPRRSAASRHVLLRGWGDQITAAEGGSSSGGDNELTLGEKIARIEEDAAIRNTVINVRPDDAIPPEYTAVYTSNSDIRDPYCKKYKKLTEELTIASYWVRGAENGIALDDEGSAKLEETLESQKAEYEELLKARCTLVENVLNALKERLESNQS